MVFLLQWECLMCTSVTVHLARLIGFTYGRVGGPDDLDSGDMELMALCFWVW